MISKSKKEKLAIIGVYGLVISLSFFYFKAIQSIFMLLSAILIVLFTAKEYDKYRYFLPNIILLFTFFLILILQFSSKSFKLFYESLFLFIIPFFAINLYKIYAFKCHLRKIILLYCLFLCLFCTYIIIYYYFDIKNHEFNWYHARYNLEFKTKIHGTYLGILLTLSLILYFKYLRKYYSHFLLYLIPILHLPVLIIFNSRISIYTLIFIFLLDQVLVFKKSKKNIIILFGFLILTALIVVLSGRLFEDINVLFNNISSSTRYIINYCSLHYIKQSIWIGYNLDEIQALLNQCYLEQNHSDFASRRLNCHNQYFEYLIKGGIIPFIAFISLLLFKTVRSFKRKNYLFLYINLIFIFTFMTESFLTRQLGIFTYTFFEILFLGSLFEQNAIESEK